MYREIGKFEEGLALIDHSLVAHPHGRCQSDAYAGASLDRPRRSAGPRSGNRDRGTTAPIGHRGVASLEESRGRFSYGEVEQSPTSDALHIHGIVEGARGL